VALVNITITNALKQRRLRQDRQSLVYSPCTTSGQETEPVYSYNPGGSTWLTCGQDKRKDQDWRQHKGAAYSFASPG